MTDALRTAAQQALEVLESLQGGCTDSGDGTVEAITVWCPEVIDALRAALAQQPIAEPDMRHPKIQALIGGKARREIELRLVEQLLDDPDCDLSAMDMEYWHGLHDKLREKLLAAQPAPAPAPAAQPSAEPVAWAQLGLRNGHTYVRMHYEGHLYPPPPDVQRNLNLVPLYAAPQPALARVPPDDVEQAWRAGMAVQYLVHGGYDDQWTDYTATAAPDFSSKKRVTWRVKPTAAQSDQSNPQR